MKASGFISMFFLTMVACFYAACATASGSSIVTGQTRPPVDIQTVKLYLEAPQNYEIIGLVTASCDSGWTDQESLNIAIEELKKQAARIGANGVLIEKTDKTTTGYVTTIGSIAYSIPVTEQIVSGKAIYVE